MLPIFTFHFKRQCIHLHLLEHRTKAVAASRGEVFAQTDTVDEVKVCIQYLLRCVAGQDPYQQSNDALYDEGITLGTEL